MNDNYRVYVASGSGAETQVMQSTYSAPTWLLVKALLNQPLPGWGYDWVILESEDSEGRTVRASWGTLRGYQGQPYSISELHATPLEVAKWQCPRCGGERPRLQSHCTECQDELAYENR